jgi:CheY-like chemotaxis protein
MVSLKLLLTNLLGLLRRTVDETIEIKLETEPGLWPVVVDPNQLENAIVNLVVNARDAMPDGGRVTIEAMNHSVDADCADQNPEVVQGDYALVVVSDTGSGMAPEVVRQAFEPFFTTKPVGKGTGLGLSMVFGFLQQSGGQAKIYSEVGRGTSVKLYFPRAQHEVIAKLPASPAETASRGAGGETVLVVEDDHAVRRSTIMMLTRLGYVPLEAEDGPSAMRLIEGRPRVDVLLTDVVLPKGMTGPALAETITKRMPEIKVVFMSGYTRDMMIHNGVLEDGVHLLMKPFGGADLRKKLNEVLAG